MDFLSTMKAASDVIQELSKQLDTIEHYSRTMSPGQHRDIPFTYDPHNDQDPMVRRFHRYNVVARELLEDMNKLSRRIPRDGNYRNSLGWAMAFDEISKR